MRTVIGKRIGPVPIALVAVLALAAFISAGIWLVPNGSQTAEAQSMPHVVIDVAEGIVTDDAVELTSSFTRADGDSVSYSVTRLDSDTIARTPVGDPPTPPGSDDDIVLGGLDTSDFTATADSDDDNMVLVTLTAAAGVADTPGSRYVYVTADYTPATGGDDQDDQILVFKITVVQNPIEVAGTKSAGPADLAVDGTTFAAGSYPTTGACEVVINTAGTVSSRTQQPLDTASDGTDPRAFDLAAGTNLVSGGDCITTGSDPVEVAIKNTGDTARDTVVYVSQNAGSDFTKLMPQLGKKGYAEEVFSLAAQSTVAGDAKPGEKVIEVEKDMATKGKVYVIGYLPALPADNLDKDDTTFNQDATFVVEVIFLEVPDQGESTVTVPEQIGATGTEMITVTVKDETGNAVRNTNVDFRLVDADSSIKFSNGRQVLLGQSDASGMETATVNGLPKTGAVRVELEVQIGDDITETHYLIRKGDPDAVKISGYADCNTDDGCDEATADAPIAKATGDSFFIRAIASDSAGNYLTKEEASLVVAGYDDASDDAITIEHINTAEEISAWWEALDCALMNDVVSPMGNEPAVGPDNATSPYCKHYPGTDFPASSILSDAAKAVVDAEAMRWYEVTIKDDAKPAEDDSYYAMKATAGTGDDKVTSDKIGFAVLGGIDELALTGPERLGTSQIVEGFTVAATSDDGAVPGNVKGEVVTITFSPDDAAVVVGTAGDTKNQLKLDANGMATFSVLVTPSRLGGDNLIVIASYGDPVSASSNPLEVMHRQVSTGPTNSAPRAVGTIGSVEMTVGDDAVTVNIATKFADSDGDDLSYDATSSDAGVATVSVDQQAATVTVSAVGAGEATITVSAYDGVNTTAGTQTFTVTVSEVVDTTLGAASGLTAAPGDGQVTLSWTAGENADIHWVVGITQADRAARNYGNLIWTASDSADGHVVMDLENGTEYHFSVISGQTVDGVTTWSTWTNIATATPAAAGSGGPGLPFG